MNGLFKKGFYQKINLKNPSKDGPHSVRAKRSSKYLWNLGAGPEPIRDGCSRQPVNSFAPALLLNTRLPATHLNYEITRMTTKEGTAGICVHFSKLSGVFHFLGPQEMEVGRAGYRQNWIGRPIHSLKMFPCHFSVKEGRLPGNDSVGTRRADFCWCWPFKKVEYCSLSWQMPLCPYPQRNPLQLCPPSLGPPQPPHHPPTKGASTLRPWSASYQGLPTAGR